MNFARPLATAGCLFALIVPQLSMGQACDDKPYDFGDSAPMGTPRVTNRIVNLVSPWNFPQRTWAHYGTLPGVYGAYDLSRSNEEYYELRAQLIDPASSPDADILSREAFDFYSTWDQAIPDWPHERQLIFDQIDYLASFNFNTFRLLCRRPLANLEYVRDKVPNPTNADYDGAAAAAWDGIIEVCNYIKSKNLKVILCFDLEWYPTCAEGQTCTWQFGTMSEQYFRTLPGTFFKANELGNTVLYYEIGNEFDSFLVGGVPQGVDVSTPAKLYQFFTAPPAGMTPSRLSTRFPSFQSIYQTAMQRLESKAVANGMTVAQLRPKLSAGTGNVVGAYIVNKHSSFAGGFKFPVLSIHQYDGWERVQQALQWIRSKDLTSTTPIYFGEMGFHYRDYDGETNGPLGNPANYFTTTAEESQVGRLHSMMWEAIGNSNTNPLKHKVTGAGIWASCDLSQHFDDPDVTGDDGFRTEFVWGLLEVVLDNNPNHPTPGDPCQRTWKIYHRKALEELWRLMNQIP